MTVTATGRSYKKHHYNGLWMEEYIVILISIYSVTTDHTTVHLRLIFIYIFHINKFYYMGSGSYFIACMPHLFLPHLFLCPICFFVYLFAYLWCIWSTLIEISTNNLLKFSHKQVLYLNTSHGNSFTVRPNISLLPYKRRREISHRKGSSVTYITYRVLHIYPVHKYVFM